jgi:hypothetical protein
MRLTTSREGLDTTRKLITHARMCDQKYTNVERMKQQLKELYIRMLGKDIYIVSFYYPMDVNHTMNRCRFIVGC